MKFIAQEDYLHVIHQGEFKMKGMKCSQKNHIIGL